MTPTAEDAWLRSEISFTRQRIANAKHQLKASTAINSILINQLSSNDTLTDRSISTSIDAKISSSNYAIFYDRITRSSTIADIDDSIIAGVYRYQSSIIDRLTDKLMSIDHSSKMIDRRLTDIVRIADRIDRLNDDIDKSRDKANDRYLTMHQDELDMKNKAKVMNVDIDDASNNVKLSRTSTIIRKSTAKLKPMTMPSN